MVSIRDFEIGQRVQRLSSKISTESFEIHCYKVNDHTNVNQCKGIYKSVSKVQLQIVGQSQPPQKLSTGIFMDLIAINWDKVDGRTKVSQCTNQPRKFHPFQLMTL